MRRILIPCILALLVAAPGRAEESALPLDSLHAIVLPFANFTGRYEALESVLPVFYEQMQVSGLRVLRHEELRPILRRHRARVVGEITAAAMDMLRMETGAALALVGSIDVFEPDRSLEVLISARVIDLRSQRMLTAVSVGRIVQETERAFGRGRAHEIQEIIGEVVEELVERVGPILEGVPQPPRVYHNCGLVAVIRMDDYSSRRHGAKVLENLLIAELVERGWSVVEPGMIRELLLDRQLTARGGVSDEVLEMLRTELGVCFVLTGEVETFGLAPTEVATSVPRLEFGVRAIDARESRLVGSVDQIRDGRDGETILGFGREFSIARLAEASIRDLLDDLDQGEER